MADNGYSYIMNNLIAFDQQVNSLLGGCCSETLSSRANRMATEQRRGRKEGGGWIQFEALVNTLFWFDRGANGERHCELAYLVEMRGDRMPKSMIRKCLIDASVDWREAA